MKYVLLIVAAFSLSGCVTVGEVIDTGAEANDEAVSAARFVICSGASVGSIRRAFSSPKEVEAWKSLCMDDEFIPLP